MRTEPSGSRQPTPSTPLIGDHIPEMAVAGLGEITVEQLMLSADSVPARKKAVHGPDNVGIQAETGKALVR